MGHWLKQNWPKLTIALLVALCVGVALFLRIYLPYDKIFGGDVIKFSGTDVYYHMRQVDSLVYNFPHHTVIDPYRIYPGASGIISLSFFEWLLAITIWVVGLGSPTQHTIDVVAVYFPAVLAGLTIITVYFLGKELFGRGAGVVAAGLMAIFPGEFLGRSILGFTDHDVINTLLTTLTMLFLLLAIKAARQRELSLSHIYHRQWVVIARPALYSLLAGVFLGFYLLTWQGALLFIFIIAVYFIIQSIIDHLRHKSSDYLYPIGVILFLVALSISLPIPRPTFYLVSLIIALLIPAVMSTVSQLMVSRKIKPAYYPLSLAGLGITGVGLLYLISPSLVSAMLKSFSIFTPSGVALTTIEMQSLITPISPGGGFFETPAWGNFNISFLLFIAVLLYWLFWKILVRRQWSTEENLVLVWTVIILLTAIGQRRFASYLVVNIGLLTGYLSWRFLEFAGFRERVTKVAKEKLRPGFRITLSQVNMALAVLIVFLIVFLPNVMPVYPNALKVVPSMLAASQVRYAPSDSWVSSLVWLKENTPDPFSNPDYYYQVVEAPPPGEKYTYPESAYGVTAWWDYGYWITRIAHRIPSANPSQAPKENSRVARFFTAQDEVSANEIAQEMGTAYVILDFDTATGKFHAMARWAGRTPEEFFDIYYYKSPEGQMKPIQLFYPEYYRSLSTRLYNFNGQAVTAQKTIVIAYRERVTAKGETTKQITRAELFDSYDKASDYLSAQESGNYRIVSDNPFMSPVPLEAAAHYQPIYSSSGGLTVSEVGIIPVVKIFEYTD
ncbi:MAG: oligosaccharyl transferase, archaeosortase A system-associated [Dehalococcoidia bacterium]|nr:MAG: oligosaccharyl transferase, archaeosortase A system-associated [Dehalococcoidia bacterium]